MRRAFLVILVMAAVVCIGGGAYTYVSTRDSETIADGMDELEAIRPRNMIISEVTATSFVVEWEVNAPVSGYVTYGDTSNSVSLLAQDVNGAEPSRRHTVSVYGLTPGKKYYFWVMSDDVAFGKNSRALEVLSLTE